MAARAPGARLCVTQLWGRTHTRGTAPSPESLLRPRPAFPEPPVLSVGPGPVVNRKQQLRVASDAAVQSDASSMTGNTVSLLGAQSGGPSDVRHRAATRLWEQPGATGGGRLAPGRARRWGRPRRRKQGSLARRSVRGPESTALGARSRPPSSTPCGSAHVHVQNGPQTRGAGRPGPDHQWAGHVFWRQ